MAKIGVVVRPGIEEAAKLACELIAWAAKQRHEILLEQESKAVLGCDAATVASEELVTKADPIVTLGGDGTLIGIARHVRDKSPVLLGVNFGTLGFLTETAPAELFPILEQVLTGKAKIGQRSMLQVECLRGGQPVFSSQAVNDVVIQKGVREKLVDFDMSLNDESLMRIRADGVIVSTPTGSTAYSLSAGGSIVHPSLQVMLITPICPHSLTYRPLIVPTERELRISFPPSASKIFLIVDGQISVPLQSGDELRVRESRHAVRFVQAPHRSYFDILRGKLNWGIANKSEL
ncbi:MAG: NAD(+)/NADH kinase [Oligoflexia bacterium]|nr:NAD(+)/NADH kinase [Oligoflexia bacterium]